MNRSLPIRLLGNQESVQELVSRDTTAWADLSVNHDAVRIVYDQHQGGHEELYRISDDILLRTIYNEMQPEGESAATSLAGHMVFGYKLFGKNTLIFEDGQELVLTPNKMAFGYSSKGERFVDRTPGGDPYVLVSLLIKPQALLLAPMSLDPNSLPESVNDIFDGCDCKDYRQVNQVHTIDDQCRQCLLDLLNCNLKGALRRSYMQAKALELICLTLNLLNKAGADEYRQTLRADDREKLEALRLRLNELFRNSPSIADLAKQVNMSEAKLKKSFKGLFGITIGEHLQQIRMRHAVSLLKASTGNINHIASELGYEHTSNFITAFKRQFGMTPKAYQKQIFQSASR